MSVIIGNSANIFNNFNNKELKNLNKSHNKGINSFKKNNIIKVTIKELIVSKRIILAFLIWLHLEVGKIISKVLEEKVLVGVETVL